jgi:lysine 2,3-aminomutase
VSKEKELVVSDDDKPPTRSASTQPQQQSISVRNITARPAPYIHRDIDPRFDRTKIRARAPRESRRVRMFRRAHYPLVTDAEWTDWRWQSRNRIKNIAQLENLMELSSDERRALVESGSMLPLGITPYYVALLDPTNPNNALRRTVIPVTGEFLRGPGEADDPLGEDGHSPVPGLVHRYPDRVLFLALDFCTTYCRCTRSRVVGHGELAPSDARLESMFDYIEEHRQSATS